MNLPFRLKHVGPWALTALLLLTPGCRRKDLLMRTGPNCTVKLPDGTTRPLSFGRWYTVSSPTSGSDDATRPLVEVHTNGEMVGWTPRDCLSATLPRGAPHFVALGGADLRDQASLNSPIVRRLTKGTQVLVVEHRNDFAMVAHGGITVGFTARDRLTLHQKTLAQVIIELHWLFESGHQLATARAMRDLGAEALRADEARDLVCRVAYGGLPDASWVEQLQADDCPGRPALEFEPDRIEHLCQLAWAQPCPAHLGLDTCDRACIEQSAHRVYNDLFEKCPPRSGSQPNARVRTQSPTATAWACPGLGSNAQLFVADYRGRVSPLGEVTFPAGGPCPRSTILAVHTVGLGVCVEVLQKKNTCDDTLHESKRILSCLPGPGPTPKFVPTLLAVEVTLAYDQLTLEPATAEECVSPVALETQAPTPLPDAPFDPDGCMVSRRRRGGLADFFVVRSDPDYLLCVLGAHEDSGPRHRAYRFAAGQIVELDDWPPRCARVAQAEHIQRN